MITFRKLPWQQVKYVIIWILFWKLNFLKKNILNYLVSVTMKVICIVFIHYFVATLSDLLEQLMDIQADTTGPERLVREAAQGHAENVKDIVTKHPDKVSESERQPFGQQESLKRLVIQVYIYILGL